MCSREAQCRMWDVGCRTFNPAHPTSHIRDPTSPSAFSLIELLVVIAVVTLLIGLMVPALGQAREAGRAAVCGSNLGQLALANDLYAGDSADRFAPGAPDVLKNLFRWHGSRTNASAAFVPAGGTLSRYISGDSSETGASAAVRACPTFAPTAARLQQANVGFERSTGGYAYNNAFVGTERQNAGIDPSSGRIVWKTMTDLLGSARSRFGNPSRTLGFADAAFADGNPVAGVIEYSFAEPRFWPDGPQWRADPSIHFRHGARTTGPQQNTGSANIAWLDGHVRAEKMMFRWSSGFYPGDAAANGIGWTGTEDDNSIYEYR